VVFEEVREGDSGAEVELGAPLKWEGGEGREGVGADCVRLGGFRRSV
jgi:hypothetical protein